MFVINERCLSNPEWLVVLTLDFHYLLTSSMVCSLILYHKKCPYLYFICLKMVFHRICSNFDSIALELTPKESSFCQYAIYEK